MAGAAPPSYTVRAMRARPTPPATNRFLPSVLGPCWPAALSVLLAAAAEARAQISLAELPELARARAERLRPMQVQALEPFWADLSLDYRDNQQFLDERIAKAAALGDSVVPLLLEKLQPPQSGATSRNLAANCRRVLERLDPGSFVDALVELAKGTHDIARSEAIRLLGHARVPQARRVLADLVDQTNGEDRQLVLRSLRQLRAAEAAPRVVPLLGSADSRVREDVLAYLIAARASSVVDAVVQAMAVEQDNRMLPLYVDYFAACAHRHPGATAALLPLLDRERLDWQDTRRLVKALADIAPIEHEPTCRALHALIDGNDTSSLAVQAAVSLQKLGDKQGASRLKRSLDDKLRRRKREAALYEQRASLLFEIGEYGDAIDDYRKILEYTEGIAMTRRAYVGLIKSEARRRKIQNMIKYLRDSEMTVLEIQLLGEEDEAVRSALEHDRTRKFLAALAREQAPR